MKILGECHFQNQVLQPNRFGNSTIKEGISFSEWRKRQKVEFNRLKNEIVVDTPGKVDVEENVKLSGKVFEIYESVTCEGKPQLRPFRSFVKFF